MKLTTAKVSSIFRTANLSTRCYLWLRSKLTPYEHLASAFPAEGQILDLGCGHGLLSFALALGSQGRKVVGVDHDPDRARIASDAALDLASPRRPRFQAGDLRAHLASVASGSLAGVAMIDILHYFDRATQEALVNDAARVITGGGVLVVRDIDADAGIKAATNELYERFVTVVGFTRSTESKLSFRTAREWTVLLESCGFSVRSHRSGPQFLADMVFIGRRL